MSGIRISYTANNKYQDCPRSWYLHYLQRLREKVQGSALSFGNAMDAALNELLNTRDMTRAKEFFERHWKTNEINGKKEDLRKTDKIKWYKSDLDESLWIDGDIKLAQKYHPEWVTLRRKGLMLLEAYEQQVMPHIKEVIAVQEYVRIDNPGGDYIMGYVDLVAKWYLDETIPYHNPELAKFNDKIILFDNKTSSQKYKSDSVKESGQLGTYTENHSEDYEVDYEGYIVLPKKFRKKKEPLIPVDIIIDTVADETIEHQFQEYEDTITGIRLGQFPRIDNCKSIPFGCPYENYCASCGKNMEGLVQLPNRRDNAKS